jgi:hypothetical protein
MTSQLKSNRLSGMWFWLKWILTTIGGFLVSLLFWNWIFFTQMKTSLKEPGIAIGWMAAVFGTWLVTLIPMMKKKETVGGHMGQQDPSPVTWWLVWISLAIGSFFIAVWFWTPFIAERFGSIRNSNVTLIWIVAVFGTWLVILTPLMVFMYWKVDKAYEDVRIRREERQEKVNQKPPVKIRGVLIDQARRQIPKKLSQMLKRIPNTIKGGHLMTAVLRDGRRMNHVFIAKRKELLGIYDQSELTFEANDIVDLEPINLDHPPDFTEKTWLRLDGNTG